VAISIEVLKHLITESLNDAEKDLPQKSNPTEELVKINFGFRQKNSLTFPGFPGFP
jgi:hypothetical protein